MYLPKCDVITSSLISQYYISVSGANISYYLDDGPRYTTMLIYYL